MLPYGGIQFAALVTGRRVDGRPFDLFTIVWRTPLVGRFSGGDF